MTKALIAVAAFATFCLTVQAQVVVPATYSATGISSKPSEGAEEWQINFADNAGKAEAGGQRSSNGSIDANNQRSARTFVDFEVTSQLKTAAASGSSASLSFRLLGVTDGTAELPELSLILLGTHSPAINGSTNLASLWNGSNLWNAPLATGIDASTTGLNGTTVVTNFTGAELTQFLSAISNANVTEYVTFEFYGGPRLSSPTAVSLAGRSVYEFSSAPGEFALSITASAIPEPSTSAATAACLALVCAMWRRRQQAAVASV